MTSTKPIKQQPVPHPTFQDRRGQTWYRWKGTAVLPHVVDMYCDLKRFTDAELDAEYWRAKWTGLMAEKHGNCLTDEGRAKIRTVERFATLPHAAETNYE